MDNLRAASKLAPEDYTLWNKLGATLANNQEAAEAMYAYQQALNARPAVRRCSSRTCPLPLSHVPLQSILLYHRRSVRHW